MTSRTPIGGLLLESLEDWAFHVGTDGVVAAQRSGDSGLLRIFSTQPNELRQPVTHEQCLSIARARADLGDTRAFATQMMQAVCGPFGSARFRRRDERGRETDDLVRIWYCNRPSGLIIGVYTCSLESARTSRHGFIASQCAHMIGSAIFDRPSWGGDDELTKVLIMKWKDDESLPDADHSR